MTGEPREIARVYLACYGQLASIASRRSDLPPIQPANRPQTFPYRARPSSAADSRPMEPGTSSMRGQLALLSLGGQSGRGGARLASRRRKRHSSWSCSVNEAKRHARRLLVPGDSHQIWMSTAGVAARWFTGTASEAGLRRTNQKNCAVVLPSGDSRSKRRISRRLRWPAT